MRVPSEEPQFKSILFLFFLFWSLSEMNRASGRTKRNADAIYIELSRFFLFCLIFLLNFVAYTEGSWTHPTFVEVVALVQITGEIETT